jgi:hypothetical protein
MAGGNSHQRAVARAEKGRITKYISEILSQYFIASHKTVSWYETHLFWGCFTLSASLVLVAVAATLRDFRWVLIPACLLACVSWWVACRRLKSKKRRWLLLFALVGCTMIGIWRVSEATKLPPIIPLLVSTYKIPLVTVGQPLMVEIHFRNTSDSTLHAKAFGSIGVGDTTDDLSILKQNGDLAFKSAKELANEQAIDLEIPPNANMHIIVKGKSVTEDQLKDMTAGIKSIYFAGFFDYTVDRNSHETPFCGFTTKQHEIPNCQEHNQPF